MFRSACLVLSLVWWSYGALAADVIDATGRGVPVPERIEHVLPAGPPAAVRLVPAGPPAAVRLAALAPDLMVGWPWPVSQDARAFRAPEAARLPQVPRLTARDDVTVKVAALKPDLVAD